MAHPSRLQESLVQRLRGNSKFIGGGQFRSALSPAPSSPKSSGCSNCFTLRATLKKLKVDLKATKPVIDDLQYKVSGVAMLSESFVLRQELTTSLSKATAQLNDAENRLQQAEQTITKGQMQLEQTQAELTTIRERPGSEVEEIYTKLKMQQDVNAEKQIQIESLKQQLDSSHKDTLDAKQQITTLESSLQSVTQMLEAARAAMDSMQSQLRTSVAQNQQNQLDMHALNSAHDQMLLQLRHDLEWWKSSSIATEAKSKQLNEEKAQLLERLSQMEDDHRKRAIVMQDMEREAQHLQLLRRKSCGDIVGLTQKYESLFLECAALRSERDASQSEVHSSIDTIKRLQSELQSAQNQLHQLEKDLLSKKCERNTLDNQMQKLQQDTETQSQRVADMHIELKDQMEKLTIAQNQVLKQRSQVHCLQTELRAVKNENDEMVHRLDEQQQTHTKALEKAMQSLVRLCVVAPTVNVHLSGQILPCKSVLPTDAIRSIVQKDILPVFSSIFLQQDEGISPTGSSLDTWLQSLLKEMQTSIEKHLKSVFQ
ncbi:hypothetical protein THRCLA_20707 [Thraustotheca clavata]|uniref:Uncharacterized protein n=1 Tax=Thraustotheca clavata TaxID=74557 RepID=A0A1W0A4L8_9STRA|nr:hypothetical protein THRCLA_20707 [Thraustotheca clavata]